MHTETYNQIISLRWKENFENGNRKLPHCMQGNLDKTMSGFFSRNHACKKTKKQKKEINIFAEKQKPRNVIVTTLNFPYKKC